MQAEPQAVIGGKYRLLSLLGTGGMGAVWCAEHTALRQQVAVKLLDARGPGAHRAVQRFLREGQIAAAVRHRNVVYISDFGTESGTPYLVMELLDGAPLADRLFTGETFGLKRFLELMLGVLDGLAAVHAAGIIHRDIKPENIYLVQEGDSEFPKVLDFGLSRSTTPDETGPITRDGLILGTPEYISPEQARGSKTLDRRADLYSLGVLIYEALCGRIPFEAENPADLITKVLREPYVPLIEHRPDIGQALNDFVDRAMARDRQDRFASAEDMRAALEDAMAHTPELSRLCLPRTYGGASGSAHYTSAIGSMRPAARESTRSSIPTAHAEDVDPDALPSGLPIAYEPVARLAKAHARWLWPSVVAAAGVVVLVTWGLVRAGASDRRADAEAAPAVKAPPAATATPSGGAGGAPDPVASAEPVVEELPPEQDEPAPLQVTLRGVPEGARVELDGERVEGDVFELERGSGEHRIVVRKAGYRSWRVDHEATSDGHYDVELTPRPKRQRKPRRQHGSKLVRDLDF